MSILKKLLHKCSYQLGGKKVNKVNTTSIPIKNNNSLKPATQYKRVKKKDNNVSPRFFKMRVLDKILYKAKLQVGGKVIKTDKGYVENPDGILNSATIDDNKYTGIDKAKIISDKFNGQDVSTYRYKDVDYLLDYKPKGLNNIDYGISDKTYTKSVTPVSTTNTNPVSTTTTKTSPTSVTPLMPIVKDRPFTRFRPGETTADQLGITKTTASDTPLVSSTSTKTNGLNRGLFTAAEKVDKSGTTLKPAPIISSVIGNTTSQQSINNIVVQPASITTTEPQKGRGLFSRLLGKKDNKVTSDNPTSSNSTKATTTDANITSSPEPTLPARYDETITSTTTTPVLATSPNNSIPATTTSKYDAVNIPTYKYGLNKEILDKAGNKVVFASAAEEKIARDMFETQPFNANKSVVNTTESSNQIPTTGDVPTIKTNTGVNTTINQEAELSESAKSNNRYVYDDYNNAIYRPDGSKAELTSRQKRDLFYYRDNSDLPLNANKERAARIHGEQGFYKTLVGSNEKEGKAIAEKPTTDVVTDALYNGKDWNKDIYSFESKSGVVITPDGTRVTLPPDIAKDVRKSIGMYNNSGSPNEKGIQNAIRQGVEKATKSSSPASSTNNPTPVPEIKLPAGLETPASPQPKPVPVLGTDAPIKPKLTYPAQQSESVQAGMPVSQSQVTDTFSVSNNNSSVPNKTNYRTIIPDVSETESQALKQQFKVRNKPVQSLYITQTTDDLYNDYNIPTLGRVKGIIEQHGETPIINDMLVWNEDQKKITSFRELSRNVQNAYLTSAKENNKHDKTYSPTVDNSLDHEDRKKQREYNKKIRALEAAAMIDKKEVQDMSQKQRLDKWNQEAEIIKLFKTATPAPGYSQSYDGTYIIQHNYNKNNAPTQTRATHYVLDPKKVPKGYNIDTERVYTNEEIVAAISHHELLDEAYEHYFRNTPIKAKAFQNQEKINKKDLEEERAYDKKKKESDLKEKAVAEYMKTDREYYLKNQWENMTYEQRLEYEKNYYKKLKEFEKNYDEKLKEDEKRKKSIEKNKVLKTNQEDILTKQVTDLYNVNIKETFK